MSKNLRTRESRFPFSWPLVVAGAMVLNGAVVVPASAASPDQDDLNQLLTTLDAQQSKLAEQERQLQQQMQQLDEQKEALRRQQQQLDALRSRVERPPTVAPAAVAGPIGPTRLDALRGAGEPQAAQTAQAQQPVGQPPAPVERPPEVNVLSERGGVLTPKGALVFEPALDFSHTTDSRAIISGFTVLPAILVGDLDISRVNHDVLQGVSTFRYGLTNRAEVELRIPYVYGRQQTTARPLNTGSSADTTTSITGHGIGDIELAGHYQLNSGQGGSPFFIANLRVKSRTGEDPFEVPVDPDTGLPTRDATGSGFYNIEPSLTAIYPSDPAVFFANVGYLYGFARNVDSPLVGGVANIKPGDAIRFSFGLGFGINEASSFSLGYDYSAFLETKVNHVAQAGTDLQIGSVLIGYSYRFSDRFSANVTTEIGVTSDAPNTRVILRFPIKFQVFD
jgi:outer membrane putative beta-barrel porin/alpha-amylase